MKLINHLHLTPKLRMLTSVSPVPNRLDVVMLNYLPVNVLLVTAVANNC